MKKTKKTLLILLLIFTLLAAQTASAELADEDVPDAIEIIRLINEYRASLGLNPYTFDQKLALAAQGHAEYQASILSEGTHVGGTDETRTSTDRARLQGYNGDISYFRTDEMIYNGGFATPQRAFDWWKQSPIHNGIMISEIYHEIGVGITLSSEGRIYYVVNVGMIPNVTTPGDASYRAPSVDEYKPAASIEIVTASPGADGSVFHRYKQGETLPAIAVAYGIPLEELRTLNDLSLTGIPMEGQLLVIKLPSATPTPTITPTPVSTETPAPTEPPVIGAGNGDTTADGGGTGDTTGDTPSTTTPAGERNLGWLWVLLAVALVGAAGALYWYWPRLRKTAEKEGIDLERWLRDDLEEEEGPVDNETLELLSTTAEFDLLPRQQQVTLLKEVARQALQAYPLEVVEIELLRYILNAEFLVHARLESNPGNVQKYVLRVNAPNFNARAEIHSEMEWLNAIVRDTKLMVPVPVKTREGSWVQTVDHPALGIFRHCVVFEYLPARAMEETITPTKMEFLGAMIGLIHKHGANFNPPRGFIRKHWDLEGLRGEMLDVPITQALAALTEEERAVLKKAEKIVAEAMHQLGTGPKVYGLIHGDLHLKSLLFSPDGRPVVIDFDTCGYGYYVYDLAVAIWNIFNRGDYAALCDALLSGYRKVRPLSEKEESLITSFVAGRLMIQILIWAPRRMLSTLNETADKAIDRQIAQLQVLLKYFVK
ncbi:MAG: phosphotransferase [Anaerolineales bacterium]|nr:phosphotransferase [Anaerolineales bacterium]